MSFSIHADVTALKNKQTGGGSWVWCAELTRDSSNVSYYTSDPENVTWNGNTYTPHIVSCDPPGEDAHGSVTSFDIEVSNRDYIESAYLEADKYFEQYVALYRVNLDELALTPSDFTGFFGKIEDVKANAKAVIFVCGAGDIRKAVVPRERIHRGHCGYRDFKGDECGYSGGETQCDRTYDTCKDTMNNHERFGGYHFMPIKWDG